MSRVISRDGEYNTIAKQVKNKTKIYRNVENVLFHHYAQSLINNQLLPEADFVVWMYLDAVIAATAPAPWYCWKKEIICQSNIYRND